MWDDVHKTDAMLSTLPSQRGCHGTCRASKSAQNQLSRCMSIEFARRKQAIAVIMLHPGTVDTDLSLPFQKVHLCLMRCHPPEVASCLMCFRQWCNPGRCHVRLLLGPGGCLIWQRLVCTLQNVLPEKLFTRERAVQQLLGIIDGVSMADNGRFIAWDGQDIPF